MRVPDCPVCWDRFNRSNRVPRLLRCGHTVCQACLECLPTENRRCPECRYPCSWRSANEFPKNFILLRAMELPASAESAAGHLSVRSILSDMHISLPLPKLVWADFASQRLLRQKLWQVLKLSCISGLIFLIVPVSLIPVLLAWFAAAVGFLIFISLFVAGIGFCLFLVFIWLSCIVVSGVIRLHKSMFERAVMLYRISRDFCQVIWTMASFLGYI